MESSALSFRYPPDVLVFLTSLFRQREAPAIPRARRDFQRFWTEIPRHGWRKRDACRARKGTAGRRPELQLFLKIEDNRVGKLRSVQLGTRETMFPPEQYTRPACPYTARWKNRVTHGHTLLHPAPAFECCTTKRTHWVDAVFPPATCVPEPREINARGWGRFPLDTRG